MIISICINSSAGVSGCECALKGVVSDLTTLITRALLKCLHYLISIYLKLTNRLAQPHQQNYTSEVRHLFLWLFKKSRISEKPLVCSPLGSKWSPLGWGRRLRQWGLGRPGETRVEKLQYLLSVRSVSWQGSTQGSVEGILPMSRMALGLISASVMEGRARISGCEPHGFTSKNILLLALLYENHLFFFFCSNQVYGSAFSQVADLLTDRMCCIVS